MSYSLFRMELLSKLKKQHDSRTKFASTLAKAYDKFANRHFEVLSGGGRLIATQARVPILQAGIQLIMEKNLLSRSRVNLINDLEPYIKAYWSGMLIIGGAGQVIITNAGFLKGPPIIENNNLEIMIAILIGCLSIHMLTMTGTYVNYYTGVTTPWSSVLLRTIP